MRFIPQLKSWGFLAWIHLKIENAEIEVNNLPPNIPSIPSGKSEGKTGEIYSYITSTYDLNNETIWYLFDWGDETYSDYVGPYNSNITCESFHNWNEDGDYEIRVKAKDEHGLESEWSDPLSITMPKNKAINNPFLQFLERLIERFPILEQILLSIYDKLTGF